MIQSPRGLEIILDFSFGFLMALVQSYGHDPDMNSKYKNLNRFVPMDMIRNKSKTQIFAF